MFLRFLMNYLARYMVVDYLLDLKERIAELEEKLKRTTNESRKPLIKSQIAVYREQGLEALARFDYDCPRSVRDYFLGYRGDKPEFEEISSQIGYGGDQPPEKCPRCQDSLREIPAGISRRTDKPYKKFWVCNNPLCDFTWNYRRNSRKTRKVLDNRLLYISISIAIGVLTILALFE